LWTISVEIGFYVVLGALWLVIRRLRRRAGVLLLAGVAGASLLLAAVTGTGQDPTAVSTKLLGSSPFPYLWVFLIGSVARLCWPYVRWAVAGRAWLWTPLAILGYHVIPGAGNPSGIGWLGQFAGLLLLGLMAISWAFTATRTADRLLRGIDISYGVYLYHFLWINTAIQEGWARNWATAGLIAVITFGCALSSWFAIELPALRLKNRVPTRRATAVAQGEPSPMGDAEAAAARK
jgi:peptidoglycan/LPS O-acetylase OafA/YrhL